MKIAQEEDKEIAPYRTRIGCVESYRQNGGPIIWQVVSEEMVEWESITFEIYHLEL